MPNFVSKTNSHEAGHLVQKMADFKRVPQHPPQSHQFHRARLSPPPIRARKLCHVLLIRAPTLRITRLKLTTPKAVSVSAGDVDDLLQRGDSLNTCSYSSAGSICEVDLTPSDFVFDQTVNSEDEEESDGKKGRRMRERRGEVR